MNFTSCRAITGYVWCGEVTIQVDTALLDIACNLPWSLATSTAIMEPLS